MRDIQIIVGERAYRPWVPSGRDAETTFRSIVMRHADRLMPDFRVFPTTRRIVSAAGAGAIPDAIAVDLRKRAWGIVEFELASHSGHSHVVPQLSRFLSAVGKPETRYALADSVYEQIMTSEDLVRQVRAHVVGHDIHKALDFIYRGDQALEPLLLLVVDRYTPQLAEALAGLKANIRVVEVVLYVPEGSAQPGEDVILYASLDRQTEIQVPTTIGMPQNTQVPSQPSLIPVHLQPFEGRMNDWRKAVFKAMHDLALSIDPRLVCSTAKGSASTPYVNFILRADTVMRVRHTLQASFYPTLRQYSLRISDLSERDRFLEEVREGLSRALRRLQGDRVP